MPMNPFRNEPRRPGTLALRYAWTRNERALGVLLWTALFALLLVISR